MPDPAPKKPASTSSGSKKPVKLDLTLDKKIACCPANAPCAVGEDCRKIVATGRATRDGEIATDVQVTVTGPGGALAVGNGEATLHYVIRNEDCGEVITFKAKAGNQEKEETADIIKIEFNGMGDPHRIGITGKIDRTQKLTASVSPKKYASAAVVTVGQFLTLKKSENDPNTGLVKFDIVGEKPGSRNPGDTFVKIVVKDCIAERKVSVIIPKAIFRPHQQGRFKTDGVNLSGRNINTSPAEPDVPANRLQLTNGVTFFMTIGVIDQFGIGIGDLYVGSAITENEININQTLKKDSNYSDPVGVGFPLTNPNSPDGFFDPNDPDVQNALKPENNPFQPFTEISPWAPVKDYDVAVDGFSLSPVPAMVGRRIRFIPPLDIEIEWP